MKNPTPFHGKWLPYLLILPQMLITFIFFLWPAGQSLVSAFQSTDPFGLHTQWVGWENFTRLITDPNYLYAFWVTFIFSTAVALLTLSMGLLFALLVYHVVKGQAWYKTFLLWPYAVAPAIAGILWRFLFNPSIGVISTLLAKFGIHWNYLLKSHQAMLLVVLAASWQQFSYNFLFFLAGLQRIPKNLIEAAIIDGAGPFKRFKDVIFPLLSPTTFFLLTMNLIYAFFDTFGIIQVVTQGGPMEATNTLVYKVYWEGFVGLDIGASAAQSVILMTLIIGLTVIQFRTLEKRVHYT